MTLALAILLLVLLAHEVVAWRRMLREIADPHYKAQRVRAWIENCDPPCNTLGHEFDNYGCRWCDRIKVSTGWWQVDGNGCFLDYRGERVYIAKNDNRLVHLKPVCRRWKYSIFVDGLIYIDPTQHPEAWAHNIYAGIFLEPWEIDLYLMEYAPKDEDQEEDCPRDRGVSTVPRSPSRAPARRSRYSQLPPYPQR